MIYADLLRHLGALMVPYIKLTVKYSSTCAISLVYALKKAALFLPLTSTGSAIILYPLKTSVFKKFNQIKTQYLYIQYTVQYLHVTLTK